MLILLLLIVITNAYPCPDADFQECHFISSHCEYTPNYINEEDNKQFLTKFEYKLKLNSSIYSLNTFIYENVLGIFIYHDKYPDCASFNFLSNKTVDCIICSDLNIGLILNPNYRNILDQISDGLVISFSVLGGIIGMILIIIIIGLLVKCKR